MRSRRDARSWRGRFARPLIAPALAAGATIALLAALAGGGSAAADEPDSPDVNLRVTVAPGAAANGPAAPTAPPASSVTTRTTVGGSTTVTGSTTPPTPAADDQSIGGILYVSGLRTEYAPSINPLGGSLHSYFTVLNVSGSTIDSTARFWVTNLFGAELSSVGPVDVTGLKPNESRVVEATLTGVGQWTFTTASFTLTPPETVEGTALEPLTRNSFVFIPPWFLLILAALGAGAYAVVRVLRSDPMPESEPGLAESTA